MRTQTTAMGTWEVTEDGTVLFWAHGQRLPDEFSFSRSGNVQRPYTCPSPCAHDYCARVVKLSLPPMHIRHTARQRGRQ